MPSDKVCCVPGCSEAGGDGVVHPVLHLFPNPKKDRERFDLWISCIGGHIIELPSEHVYKYRRVCHAHFEQKFWCRYNRLSNIAIPTLNLDQPSTSMSRERPLSAIENAIEHFPSSSTDQPSTSMSRKRPLSSIENVIEHFPSSSTDHPSPSKSRKTTPSSTKNVLKNLPSTKSKEMDADISKQMETKPTAAQSVVTFVKKSKGSVKIKSTTLAERNLIKKLSAAKIKLSKYKNKISAQAAALKISKNIITNPSTSKALENLPKSARILTLLQLRESKKRNKGRRFTYEEKIVALTLLKQSPKGYRLLRKIFILPAPQTLIKLITKANIQPGVNENIFNQMKIQAEKMKISERLCILLFDEMSLKSNMTYNERLDKVIGFVSNGQDTTKEFANHAQVFMIRGLLKNYKQPIGYTFSASTTKGPELAKQIKLFVREIRRAGFIVVASVCDQGSGNRNAIKLLIEESKRTWIRHGEEPKNNVIIIDDTEFVPLYDAPHLIKCVRNNLMIKNLTYMKDNTTKTAKWSHVERLYEENPAYQGLRLIPKLTENHVKPAKMNKMKVKLATQIFSQTVATNMGYLADKQIIPMECKETADILLFFDKLFDSMNGSYNKKYRFAKPALGPVTPSSAHHGIWLDSKKILKTMKFGNNKNESVPTINNWVWTLDGMEVLFKMINLNYGVSSIWARHLNQDPLENFFGSIRNHGCRNTNPTPERFQSAFATLLINSLASVHAPGNNCEDDVAVSLHALVINEDCNAKNTDISEIDLAAISVEKFTPVEIKLNNPVTKATIEYCSGYFAKKCRDNIFKKCKECNINFIDSKESEYLKYREFKKKRWLCSPSRPLINCFSEMQDITKFILIKNIMNNHIKEVIKTVLCVFVDFNFINCKDHKDKLIKYLVNCVSRFFIYNYCKNLNNILSGRRNVDDVEDMLQIKAKNYFDKSYKRKK